MGSPLRLQLPPAADPVRAELHAFLDRLLDIALATAPTPTPPAPAVLPLATAAKQLGWSRRRLRAYCLEQGVAVLGRGQRAAVTWAELEAALAAQPRVKHDAPSTELDPDIKDWLKGA